MKFSMKMVSASLLLLVFIASCSSDKKHKAGGSNGNPITTIPGGGPAQTTGDSDSTVLQLIPETGSSMRFLDARGLTEFYKNVFPMKAFGFMHCATNKPFNASDCTDSIFTKDERPAMGVFDLGSPRINRALQNVNPSANLTLNYTRTLRAALSRECSAMVDAEIVKFKAKDLAGNNLVKADKPSATDINEFMKKILGLSGTAVAVTVDAEAYAAAFDASILAAKDKNTGMRNAYVGICIALSMDPLVFIY